MSRSLCIVSWLWPALCLVPCAVHLCAQEASKPSTELQTFFGEDRWQHLQDLVSRGYAIKDQKGYYRNQDELLKCFLRLREVVESGQWSWFTALQQLARQEWARGIADDLLLEFADGFLEGMEYDRAIEVYDEILLNHSDGVPCVEWLKFPDRYDSDINRPEEVFGTYCFGIFTRSYPQQEVKDPGRTIDLARAGKAIALLNSGRFADVVRLMDQFLERGESPGWAFGGDYPPVVEAYFYKAIALKELGASDVDIHALRDEMVAKGLQEYIVWRCGVLGPIDKPECKRLGRTRLRVTTCFDHMPKVPEELMLAAVEATSQEDETTSASSKKENDFPARGHSTIGDSEDTSQQSNQAAVTESPSSGRSSPVKPCVPLGPERHPERGPSLGEIMVYVAAGLLGMLGLGIALFHLLQHGRLK